LDADNDTLDFETWKKWHKEKYLGGVDEDGVASISLSNDEEM
jgi:hypothetical protein